MKTKAKTRTTMKMAERKKTVVATRSNLVRVTQKTLKKAGTALGQKVSADRLTNLIFKLRSRLTVSRSLAKWCIWRSLSRSSNSIRFGPNFGRSFFRRVNCRRQA